MHLAKIKCNTNSINVSQIIYRVCDARGIFGIRKQTGGMSKFYQFTWGNSATKRAPKL